MDNKLLLFLIVGLLCINFASAMDWDNVINYENEDKVAVFDNALGFGKTIARAEILTPIENHQIIRGKDRKVIIYNIENYWEDYDNGLKDVEITDLKTGKRVDKEFHYEYAVYDTRTINDYERVCSDKELANKSIQTTCVYNKIGESEQEYIKEWKILTDTNIPSGNTTIALVTDVEAGDNMDGIFIMFGKRIKKHATWNETYDEWLLAYYGFDETTGTNVLDSNYSLYNGTIVNGGSGNWTENGINDNALDIAPNVDVQINHTILKDTISSNNTGGFTVGGWVRFNASGMPQAIVYSNNIETNFLFGVSAGDVFSIDWGIGAGASAAQMVVGKWYHVAVTYDKISVPGTYNTTLWVNGSSVYNYNYSHSPGSEAGLSIGGRIYDANQQMNGTVDEFAIWNRTLSMTEISDWYNNGVGIFFAAEPPAGTPNVILNFPEDDVGLRATNVTFNCTAKITGGDQVDNITLYHNATGTWHANETYDCSGLGLDNVTHDFDLNIIDGGFIWNCLADSNQSMQAFDATNYTFIIDTIYPLIKVDHPYVYLGFENLTGSNYSLNYTVTETGADTCWFNYNQTNMTVPCTTNSTFSGAINFSNLTFYVNDTVGNENSTLVDWTWYFFSGGADRTITTEGDTVNFRLEVNLSNIPTTAATLNFNNTRYTPDTITATINQYIFEKSMAIPVGSGNSTGHIQSWNWNFSISETATQNTSNTTFQDLIVYEVGVDDCSTYGGIILNFTLKDESLFTDINSTVLNNTVEIDIDLFSRKNNSISWEYSNTFTNQTNITICVPYEVLNSTTGIEYGLNMTTKFEVYGYVEEFYRLVNQTISNSTTPINISLMDLHEDDSTTIIISVKDETNNLIRGAVVQLLRYFVGDGIWRIVESVKTNGDAIALFHVIEEDELYKINVTEDGQFLYLSSQTRMYCVAGEECRYEFSSFGDIEDFKTDFDKIEGGGWSITAEQSIRLITLEFYLPNVSEMNLTIYKYSNNISEASKSIGSNTTTASSGIVTVHVPLSYGNATYYAVVFRDDVWIGSKWARLVESGRDYFGKLGAFMAAMMVLALALMAVSLGVGVIVFAILGLIIAVIVQMLDIKYATLLYFIIASLIIIWKISIRRMR